MRSERLILAPVLAAALTVAGCGGGGGMSEVSGTVKVDGQPAEAGSVQFTPADGNGPTAGGEIKGGKYSVQAPRGLMKVSIIATKVTGKKKLYPTPDSPEVEIRENILPPRYNDKTELTYEVKPGKNPKDWDLTSK